MYYLCTNYKATVAVWALNNFKPPCKTRAPRVSWSIYWFCGTSITFAFNLRSLDGCPHIFVHGHVASTTLASTDRHLPCILFSISMQYSNIPCSKSHPSQSTKYQMSHPSSPQMPMLCALKRSLRPAHFSKRKSQATHSTFVMKSYCTHKYGRILTSTTSSRLT